MSNTVLTKNLKGTYGTLYYVKNMSRAVEWYKALGLQPSHESEEWTEFPINDHSLCLHIADPKSKENTSGLLILHVNNIRDIVADLKTKGVKIIADVEEVFPGADAFSAKVSDLDGNLISLYQGLK